MKTITHFFISLALVLMSTFCANAQNGWRPGEMEVNILIETKEQAKFIEEMNVNGEFYPNGQAVLYLTPKEFETIRNSSISYEVVEEDLSIRQTIWEKTDAYHTVDEILELMDSLQTEFPEYCQKYVVGYSVEGRELAYLKISDNVSIDEPEPEVCFDGGYHGDEVGGPENLIRFAKDLCLGYGEDETITQLVNEREIYLYVMVNPDGRYNDARYNANGIDLNRDFGYMWDGDGGSPGFYSQIESKVFRDFVLDNQFTIQITYHSGIEYIIYPWGFHSNLTPDYEHHDVLGNNYANQSGYTNIPVGPIASSLYTVNGGSSDGYYGIMGSAGHCVELSADKHPAESEIGYFYDINYQPMLGMLEAAKKGIHGMVADQETGEPVAAIVFVDDLYGVYSDPEVGDFHKYLEPGTYNLTIKANGYQTQTLQDVVIEEDSAHVGTINMVPGNENDFIYKLQACQIPGGNEDDESFTQFVIGKNDGNGYSLGYNGVAVFEMPNVITDRKGPDFKIYEDDSEGEGYSVYGSDTPDGSWRMLGEGLGTEEFDLADANLQQARFFKIKDDGEGSISGFGAGFDLDAAEHVPAEPGIYINLYATELVEINGNGNGRPDPGEEFELTVELQNRGDQQAVQTFGTMATASPYLTLSDEVGDFGDIDIDQTAAASYNLIFSESAPIGTVCSLSLIIEVSGGEYFNNFAFNYSVGLIIEDFETGDFDAFAWEFPGSADWEIDNEVVYEGANAAKSGSISDTQVSSLELEVDVSVDDSIQFFAKVSSESNYDFLHFYIDDEEMGSWSGELDWFLASYPIGAGVHTLRWSYQKDYSVSDGQDCAWIDEIVLPGATSNNEALSVSISCNQDQCTQVPFQIVAMSNGGSGDYSYTWSPSEMLDHPNSATPVATISENTTFTVEVDDGESLANHNIEIYAHDRPQTPVVSLNGAELHSSAPEGNQWYLNNMELEGANQQVYTPDTTGGIYCVLVSNEYCVSDTSNRVEYAVSVEKMNWQNLKIYPNPGTGIVTLETDKQLSEIRLYSPLGKFIKSIEPTVGNQILDLQGYGEGVFYLELSTNQHVIVEKVIVFYE